MRATQSLQETRGIDLFEGPDSFRGQLRAHAWRDSALGEPALWPPALRKAYATILDVPFPMCIVWGEQLGFLYNAAYAPLLAERHPAALGVAAAQVWPTLWDALAPLVAKARAGHASLGEDLIRTNRRDGREHERAFAMAYTPLHDASGAPAGAVGVVSETTAEQRLLQRQAFQLRVADELAALSDPAAIYACASRLLGGYLNVPRVLCGDYDCAKHQVTYHANYTDGKVPELSGSFDAASFSAANFESLRSGATWVSADMARDPRTAGPDFWPVFDALGIRAGVVVPHTRVGELISCLFVNAATTRLWSAEEVALIEDVAARRWKAVERARAEAGLLQADRRKDQFLAILAHELRNPLAPISAAAELLKRPQPDPERVRATGTVIARQVQHMTALVDDLLDVSRVTSGMVVIAREPVDLKDVVADALEQVRPSIDARQHQCTVTTASGAALVLGDYQRLVQVVANLCNNAAKYTRPGGHIDIALSTGDDFVALRVADDGQGIAAPLLPHVFDLFAQGERSADRAKGGLGLGLALVKSLVELHEGSVSAVSDGLDAGSVFTVRLPRVAAPVAGDEAAGAPPPARQRLLVVDDNVDNADMLALFLEASGYDVAVEHSAEGALERSAGADFDAYLLDLGLPGMDSNALAQRLRAAPAHRDALLVAITGYGHHADGVTARSTGFDHYLVKPVDPGAIVALLEQARQRG